MDVFVIVIRVDNDAGDLDVEILIQILPLSDEIVGIRPQRNPRGELRLVGPNENRPFILKLNILKIKLRKE